MNDTNNQLTHNRKQNVSNADDKKSIADRIAEDTEPLTEYQLDDPNVISLEDLREKEFAMDDDDLSNPSTAVQDAGSVSGHASTTTSDDDTVANAQNMGIGLDETDEEPAELNIADAVARAEKEHWEN